MPHPTKVFKHKVSWASSFCVYCDNSRHISRRVSSIWAFYACMYTRILISDVSVFRMLTHMPINGREYQALADQLLSNFTVRIRNELWRTYFDQWFFFYNTVSPLSINIAISSTNYQGKMVLNFDTQY